MDMGNLEILGNFSIKNNTFLLKYLNKDNNNNNNNNTFIVIIINAWLD